MWKDGFKERKQGFSRSPLVHRLSEEELETLKWLLVDAYDEFDRTARKYGIFYTLSGGTVLGSVRHQGFIPWDDDIDLMMPRKDFNKLKTVFDKELGEKFTLSAPELGDGHGMTVCQIKRRGTVLRSYNEVSKTDAGVPLDIFVLENTFDMPLLRMLHGIACLAAGYLISVRKAFCDFPYLEPYFAGNDELRKSYVRKARLGKLVSFLTLDQLSGMAYRVYSLCRNDDSRYVTIPSGRKHFFGELYLRSDACRAEEAYFEGRKVPIPCGYKTYLRRLYGDNYMQLPPETDREQHPMIEISFEDALKNTSLHQTDRGERGEQR